MKPLRLAAISLGALLATASSLFAPSEGAP
jgi:hypothetical protein